MGVVLDSNVLILAEREQQNLDALVESVQGEEFFISVITISELLHGVERAKETKSRARRSAFVEGIITSFPVYPITTPIARAHARLWSILAREGQMIGMNDSWIAATCLACDCSLVTRDIADFQRVPGLSVKPF